MDTQSRSDEARLQAVMDQARRLVPYGSPIVALPSVRTLHVATAEQGEVLPLVLASYAFTQPQFGGCVTMEGPRVLVVEGTLDDGHLPDLLAVLEQAVQDNAALVIAAADYGETMLATLVINHQRNTLSVAALAPSDRADRSALSRLAALAQAASAVPVADRLRIERLGTLPRMLMTTRDTVVLDGPGARPLALIRAGGETAEDARANAARLRDMR